MCNVQALHTASTRARNTHARPTPPQPDRSQARTGSVRPSGQSFHFCQVERVISVR